MAKRSLSAKLNGLCLEIIFFDEIKNENDTKKYILTPIAKKELLDYRQSGKPGFVFVQNGIIYFTPIERNVNLLFRPLMQEHLCNQECKRLSAASDKMGGCRKVRELFLDSSEKNKTEISNSKRIEEYDFITLGYQTFGTIKDCLYVIECKNYERTSAITLERGAKHALKVSIREFWKS